MVHHRLHFQVSRQLHLLANIYIRLCFTVTILTLFSPHLSRVCLLSILSFSADSLLFTYFDFAGTGSLLNGKEELSLRPQKNFMFKPNTPAMLPRSAQAAPSQPLAPQSTPLSISPKRVTVDVANPPIHKQQVSHS